MIKKETIPKVIIEIKPSKLLPSEIGVFSVRPIKKGAIIIEAKHFSNVKMIKWENFKKCDPITKKRILGFCAATPEGFFAPPNLNYISIAWHLNHSCNPNVGFNDNYDFIAIRNIKKNEELCWDYGFDETNPRFKMSCLCQDKNCRKTITGIDWKKLMLDDSKKEYFSPQLKKFIKKQKIN